jgi:hypothetical protein
VLPSVDEVGVAPLVAGRILPTAHSEDITEPRPVLVLERQRSAPLDIVEALLVARCHNPFLRCLFQGWQSASPEDVRKRVPGVLGGCAQGARLPRVVLPLDVFGLASVCQRLVSDAEGAVYAAREQRSGLEAPLGGVTLVLRPRTLAAASCTAKVLLVSGQWRLSARGARVLRCDVIVAEQWTRFQSAWPGGEVLCTGDSSSVGVTWHRHASTPHRCAGKSGQAALRRPGGYPHRSETASASLWAKFALTNALKYL